MLSAKLVAKSAVGPASRAAPMSRKSPDDLRKLSARRVAFPLAAPKAPRLPVRTRPNTRSLAASHVPSDNCGYHRLRAVLGRDADTARPVECDQDSRLHLGAGRRHSRRVVRTAHPARGRTSIATSSKVLRRPAEPDHGLLDDATSAQARPVRIAVGAALKGEAAGGARLLLQSTANILQGLTFQLFKRGVINVANMPRRRFFCCEHLPNQWPGNFCHPSVMPEK
jgi:hypothetical protein